MKTQGIRVLALAIVFSVSASFSSASALQSTKNAPSLASFELVHNYCKNGYLYKHVCVAWDYYGNCAKWRHRVSKTRCY